MKKAEMVTSRQQMGNPATRYSSRLFHAPLDGNLDRKVPIGRGSEKAIIGIIFCFSLFFRAAHRIVLHLASTATEARSLEVWVASYTATKTGIQ